MNFDVGPVPTPIRVLMVNPLAPASQLVMMKILGGSIFGSGQFVDLILLVYSNEIADGETLKSELQSCAFSCMNAIKVSSDLPSISAADVFCFITNFPNPNFIDFKHIDSDDQFDTFYLLLKIAHNFSLRPPTVKEPDDKLVSLKRRKVPPKQRKPIFVADGLVALDILYNMSKYIPSDALFSPTSITNIAKAVLADYLKVTCDVINDILVWAANDEVFHIGVEDPCVLYDKVDLSAPRCVWKTMGKELFEQLKLDHTQFNASWLKNEYIAKVAAITVKNPYGNIFKAQMVFKTLKEIWNQRSEVQGKNTFSNLGIISDGSLDTIKGFPYILPLRIHGDNWKVDERFGETSFVKNEMKRINKIVREHHQKMISYCKKFQEENVVKQSFVVKDSSFSFTNRDTTTTSSSNTYSQSLATFSDYSN